MPLHLQDNDASFIAEQFRPVFEMIDEADAGDSAKLLALAIVETGLAQARCARAKGKAGRPRSDTDDQQDAEFDEFWDQIPGWRKKDRLLAKRAFRRIVDGGVPAETMIGYAREWGKRIETFTPERRQFCKRVITWLNQREYLADPEAWEDEGASNGRQQREHDDAISVPNL